MMIRRVGSLTALALICGCSSIPGMDSMPVADASATIPDSEPAPDAAIEPLPEGTPVSTTVDGDERTVSPGLFGMDLPAPVARTSSRFYAHFGDGETIEERAASGLARIRALGLREVRFPGGCDADVFDFRAGMEHFLRSGEELHLPTLTLEALLEVARDLGARIVYQLNTETKGLTNACGMKPLYPDPSLSEEEKKTILLADARELVRSYGSVIKDWELGNEQWSSWDPAEYAAVAREFADLVKAEDAAARVYLVGYPSTGNNQSSLPGTSNADAAWTRVVQAAVVDQCSGSSCFDRVTDHPYVFTGYDPMASNLAHNFPGMAAYYPIVRADMFRTRVTQYAPAALAVTEWNLKCWSKGEARPLPLVNAEIEAPALEGWILWEQHPGTGSIEIAGSGHDSAQALRVRLQRPSGEAQDGIQAQQRVDAGPGQTLQLRAWVRTDTPARARISIQQANVGVHQWHAVASSELKAIEPGVWQGVTIEGETFADTERVQVVLRIAKSSEQWAADPSPIEALFDDVLLEDRTDYRPAMRSSATVEHAFFVFESLFQMAREGVASAVYHLLNRGDCGIVFRNDPPLTATPQARAFALAASASGGSLLSVRTNSPAWRLPPAPCVSTRCLPGDVDVPLLSTYVVRKEAAFQVFFSNRSPDVAMNATVDLSPVLAGAVLDGAPGAAEALLLSARAFTDQAFFSPLHESFRIGAKSLVVHVPPLSLLRLRIPTATP